MTAPAVARRRAPLPLPRVVAAALAVAALDALYLVVLFGMLLRGATPARLFQGIARALIGPTALTGGAATALLGVAIHVGVAAAWTALWAFLYARARPLRAAVARPLGAVLVGAAYGLAIWLVMNLAVLPLTQAPVVRYGTPGMYLVLLAHLTVVGPPLVLIARRGTRDA